MAAAFGAAPVAHAGDGPPPALDAGALGVWVAADPFALEFADTRSGEVLRTLGPAPSPASPGSRYGPLGYSFDLRVPIIGNAYLGLLRRGRGREGLVSRDARGRLGHWHYDAATQSLRGHFRP